MIWFAGPNSIPALVAPATGERYMTSVLLPTGAVSALDAAVSDFVVGQIQRAARARIAVERVPLPIDAGIRNTSTDCTSMSRRGRPSGPC